jgi:hypothetical protein
MPNLQSVSNSNSDEKSDPLYLIQRLVAWSRLRSKLSYRPGSLILGTTMFSRSGGSWYIRHQTQSISSWTI